MTRKGKVVGLAAAFCMAAALAQAAAAENGPVALVYIASNPANSSNNEVVAYAAAASGKLTPVPGSPFQADVTDMAVNGLYLFGTNRNGIYIDSWRIETNGALDYAATTDINQNGQDCAGTGPLFLDHSGASLYELEYRGSGCSNNDYQSFTVEKPTGNLQNLGTNAVNNWVTSPATFIGNDNYAYTASCLGDMYWGIYEFQRSSNGLLKEIGNGTPPTPPSGDFYCPAWAAADPANHVAFTMQAVNGQTFGADGEPQIASYKAAANGALSTTNTSAAMPRTQVVSVTDLKMAPGGKLLAVAGSGGLQVFHFNGANPVTADTGLLTKDPITQMFWDNNNHLYAISASTGKLFVFTVTPTNHSQAPGSPYRVSNPQNIIVQPQPWW